MVVCALRAELRFFVERSGSSVLSCGVGPVEAAVATARALASGSYDVVINAGIGGAFSRDDRIGDARLIREESFADLGLEGGAPLVLPEGATLIERAEPDAALLARCAPLGIVPASGLTVGEVTTTDATAARLRARYGADVESMEGFSVLRAAAVCGVPALEVRGISNYVGARANSAWDFTAGARAAARALDAVLDRLAESQR